MSTNASTKPATGATTDRIDPETVTLSGYVLQETYGPVDAPTTDRREQDRVDVRIGDPGQFPFTRGVHRTMYRSRLWTMRQFAGFGSAEDTNRRFKYLLENTKGTKANTGLSTAFDLPTLMGRDSDDALSVGEVGRCGVAILPETVERLAAHPNIVAIKEATGSLDSASEIRRRCDLPILSGDDSLTIGFQAVGAIGVVSVVSNLVPDRVQALVATCNRNDFDAARTMHQALLPLQRMVNFSKERALAVKGKRARNESHDCLTLLNTLCVLFTVPPAALRAVACAPRRCTLSAL